MDPRISFSNDFVDAQQAMKLDNIYREAPVSSDFEFTVKDRCMRPADEIFFQGTLLPLKERVKTTLRDELQVGEEEDEDDNGFFPRLTKSTSGCWKERFGFKRSHTLPKKQQKISEGVLKPVEEEKTTMFLHEDLLSIARKNGNYLKKS